MSAICGILRFDGDPVPNSAVERLLAAMLHRGPDRQRVWGNGTIGLGHALMRVTQEDDYDNQPIVDPGHAIALTSDLRLDNREELAGALGLTGDIGKLPDRALLLKAYEKWAEFCVDHIIGDFAFALWDARKQILFLARDHMGARAFFYHRSKNFFAFATDRRGLCAVPEVPDRLDVWPGGADPAEHLDPLEIRTDFHGIFGLAAGSSMTVTADGEISRRRYWEPHADPVHLDRDEAYYIETYRRLLAEAVACRVRRATRPVGLFMSGGFDSAAIAGLAAPLMRAKQQKLIAVASVMPAEYQGPIPSGRAWIECCRRDMPDLEVRYVTCDDNSLLDLLEHDFVRFDGTLGPTGIATKTIGAAFAERGVRVVLDGNGGDYTVNPTARGLVYEFLRRGRIKSAARQLLALRRARKQTLLQVTRSEVATHVVATVRLWLSRTFRIGSLDTMLPLTPEYLAARLAGIGRFRPRLRSVSRSEWGQRLAALQSLQHEAEPVMRRPTAAYGLEYAQPFHDKRLIEFALAIPLSCVAPDGLERYLARKALAEVYPREFATRVRKAMDSIVPNIADLAGSLRPHILAHVSRMERSERLGRLFDFDRIRALLEESPGDPLSPQRARVALTTIMFARSIEWFERRNDDCLSVRSVQDEPGAV